MFRNLTALAAVGVSLVALYFSYQCFQTAKSANDLQATLAKRQGSYLELVGSSVYLLDKRTNKWQVFNHFPPDTPLVQIPLDVWRNSDGSRHMTVAVRKHWPARRTWAPPLFSDGRRCRWVL
jgi:hypothetical protein